MHPRLMSCCSTPRGFSSGWSERGRDVHHFVPPGHEGGFGGSAFGVRRPLRFLAWKLGLDEKQVAEVAKVLADIKTERAQADVDVRRAAAMLADLAAAAEFDQAKAKEAADLKVRAAERIRDELVKTLARLHAVLNPEQRERLAYLIRTGALQL